ncbi:hypothetical protein [Parendozoicomonas haliclonae]|uniref:Uncharacterized protein n=2 Tax=Parendozoicomonas haliclonae TaxID=1960125 RepID=A0A1X7AFG1_9GAMM|nr:hypothetical protein [Parendozoicomonas haliclonae]SMA37534.1 hypothetical protein EHSB41UT_00752 [Parendozoicomonas haliclonae]
MLRSLILAALLMPAIASAEILTCEQQQNMCEAQCQVTNIGDDKGLGTCKAKCLGKRVTCSVSSGADTVKDATENVVDGASKEGASVTEKAKAFWEGLTE